MTLWAASVLALVVALATAALLSLRSPHRPAFALLAWGLVVDLVVGTRAGPGWGLAQLLAHRPWSPADRGLYHLSNALVTSWPMAVAILAWRGARGPTAALVACWAAANAALVGRGSAPIQRELLAVELGAILAGAVALWRDRRRRSPAVVVAAWLVALEVLVVALGPFRQSVYTRWDLAQLVYVLGFAVLAIGQSVAWYRLRPSQAGSAGSPS